MNKLITNYSANKLNRIFIAQSVVFFALLINAFNPSTIPNTVILGLAMIMPIFLKPLEIGAYIAGFAMMGTGIQVAYISFACLIVLMYKSKMKVKTIALTSIFVFVIYELAHIILWQSDEMFEFLRYSVVYALLFYIMFMEYNTSDKVRVVDGYIYGCVFSIVHIFIETFIIFNGDMLSFMDGSFRFGYAQQLETNLTMAADPNLVGQSCSLAIVSCLSLIMLGYKEKKYYISMFIALIAGTLTISKTFLISLALIIVLMILFVGKWASYKMLKKRILLICLVILGCYIITKIYPTYIENIFSRVDESDITTGRTANALIYLEYLTNDIKSLLFGVGMQNVGPKIGFTGSPHAAIVEAIACWGIVGTIAIIALIVQAISHQSSNVKTRILNYIPLIVFLILVQSTQLFRLRDRLFAFVVVIVLTGIPQKGEKRLDCQEEHTISD